MCQLVMRTCTNTIPAPLPLANLLLYLMDTNLHGSLLNLCSIFTQPFVCRDIEPTLATQNNTCSTLQTVQRKDAACSKQQNPAYCPSVCPFSVGTTHVPILQAYCLHSVHPKKKCYHGPGQRCAQSQPIPLSSELAVIPDEGRLCVQLTVVVEARGRSCHE